MTYSNQKLNCESYGLENQKEFARLLDISVNIDRILLEIESVLGLLDEWNFHNHFKETKLDFKNREGKLAFLQLPEESKEGAYHGWRSPLSSFHGGYDKPWTSECKWTYRECKKRNFINPVCTCTYEFNSLCFDLPYTNELLQTLGIYKTFISIVPPLFSIEVHQDPLPKLHIPLETNEDIFINLDLDSEKHDVNKSGNMKSVHLPADGNVYYVDTTRWHTVNNASSKWRCHIVGDVDSSRLNYVCGQ
jgi:hypothetical protein